MCLYVIFRELVAALLWVWVSSSKESIFENCISYHLLCNKVLWIVSGLKQWLFINNWFCGWSLSWVQFGGSSEELQLAGGLACAEWSWRGSCTCFVVAGSRLGALVFSSSSWAHSLCGCAAAREGKSQGANPSQAYTCVTFAHISLAKIRHLVQLRSRRKRNRIRTLMGELPNIVGIFFFLPISHRFAGEWLGIVSWPLEGFQP